MHDDAMGGPPAPGFVRVEGDGLLQFWESEATRPSIAGPSRDAASALVEAAETQLLPCAAAPFKPPATIDAEKLARVRALVERAYDDVPLYAAKYRAAGIRPSDVRTWDDYARLPVVTKDELVRAFPAQCTSLRFDRAELFPTRTFGTSGVTLPILVDRDAIVTDTLQGVRQLWLQSGLRYRPDHVAAMVYTVPWWFERVGDAFRSVFVSGLIAPRDVARILAEIEPEVVSAYPSNLRAMVPFLAAAPPSRRYLAIVHSETSSAAERRAWSRAIGVPVLDEYSTEEATRIALELPCGHYHVCDDTVHLEVVDRATLAPQADGVAGVAVVTNLLNEAMPFLRYVQGDYVSRPKQPEPCLVGWSQLARIDGRVNDAFVARDGREVPAGALLDVVYRFMFDAGLSIPEFELVQRAPERVVLTLVAGEASAEPRVRAALPHLAGLLATCLGHPVEVEGVVVDALPRRPGKRRPIRREIAPRAGDG